ncbi:MAG: cobalt ECF transporter T component CbiQ [Ardenticatenales bacterium]|nr:cobalt ECF transporter T component CbiQ [Ardenticatenales bacterium]
MQSSVLDRYLARESVIHALDPRVKLLATLGFIVGNALLPDGRWAAFALAWALTVLISVRAKLGPFFALRGSFIALPFMLAGASVLFAIPGNPLARWQLGPLELVVTDAGLLRFLSLILRTWLAVQMALLLTATTTFPDLTHALRHLRVPAVLVSIVSFMYRYLFVLAEEAQRLLQARTSRSAEIPGQRAGGSVPWRAKVAGNMAGQLFVRSIERADRVYLAMVARGYQGQLLTMNQHVMRLSDWSMAGLALVSLLLIQLIGRL